MESEICMMSLNQFIHKISKIKLDLDAKVIDIDNSEVKKLTYIINLYNEISNEEFEKKPVSKNKISFFDDNFKLIDSSDDEVMEETTKSTTFDEKVLGMIKKAKIIMEFYKQHNGLSYKLNESNDNSDDDSDDEFENDSEYESDNEEFMKTNNLDITQNFC